MTASVYIAASYLRRQEVDEVIAPKLRETGFNVVSRWHREHLGGVPSTQAAMEDLEDITDSDVFLLITEEHGVYNTGGRHFETGVAYVFGLDLCIVGPVEHVFHKGLSDFTQYNTLEDFIQEFTND